LNTNAFDVLENFNVSRNHLEEKKQFIEIKSNHWIYLIFTKGVDSSASSRKLAKYGITFSVNTYAKAYIETR
jgi:predicted PP-loop superfamily ATPase